MPEQKTQLIEKLTGVYASKRSYYAELKEKISEITKRNSQLEILNDLARQISINTPLDQLVMNISDRVRQIIPFDRVSLCTFRRWEALPQLLLPEGRNLLRPPLLPEGRNYYRHGDPP